METQLVRRNWNVSNNPTLGKFAIQCSANSCALILCLAKAFWFLAPACDRGLHAPPVSKGISTRLEQSTHPDGLHMSSVEAFWSAFRSVFPFIVVLIIIINVILVKHLTLNLKVLHKTTAPVKSCKKQNYLSSKKKGLFLSSFLLHPW